MSLYRHLYQYINAVNSNTFKMYILNIINKQKYGKMYELLFSADSFSISVNNESLDELDNHFTIERRNLPKLFNASLLTGMGGK